MGKKNFYVIRCLLFIENEEVVMDFISMKNYVLRVGIGNSCNKLNAFDRALIDAGVSDYNLIRVSSILPSNCLYQKKITVQKGMILPSAYATCFSDQIGDTISSAVAVGIPENDDDIGVIMKYSGHVGKEETENIVRKLAIQAMQDREIAFSEISSVAVECFVETSEICCTFATVSMW